MLALRTRSTNGIFYIRGSVALGDKRIDVKEFSTGTRDADAASHLMAEHELRLRHRLMFGPAAMVAEGTVADAFGSYLSKPKPPCASDVLRIGKLNGLIGDCALGEPRQAWEQFRREYLFGYDPAGQDRWLNLFKQMPEVDLNTIWAASSMPSKHIMRLHRGRDGSLRYPRPGAGRPRA